MADGGWYAAQVAEKRSKGDRVRGIKMHSVARKPLRIPHTAALEGLTWGPEFTGEPAAPNRAAALARMVEDLLMLDESNEAAFHEWIARNHIFPEKALAWNEDSRRLVRDIRTLLAKLHLAMTSPIAAASVIPAMLACSRELARSRPLPNIQERRHAVVRAVEDFRAGKMRRDPPARSFVAGQPPPSADEWERRLLKSKLFELDSRFLPLRDADITDALAGKVEAPRVAARLSSRCGAFGDDDEKQALAAFRRAAPRERRG